MKRLAVVTVAILALTGAVLAQSSTWAWIIPETFLCVFGPPCPGTTQPLIEDVPVPAELQGQTCDVFASTANNTSVHEGNDAEIHSGGAFVTIFDVESSPGATFQADGQLTLGPTVDVFVNMGPDGIWSAELDMEFVCSPGDPTATPTATHTITPSPTATATTTPTATATQPGPTLTPTSTPGPTGVGLSGFGGGADNPLRTAGVVLGIAFVLALLIWNVIKRPGE